MSKCFASFLLCIGLLFSAHPCAALSDAEYQELVKTSPEFKDADRRLSALWKEVYGSLEGDYKIQVLDGQRAWVKTERDATAKAYMAKGMSNGQAYAKAVEDRINVLRVIRENSVLDEDEAWSAKADDYYLDSDEEQVQQPERKPSREEQNLLGLLQVAQNAKAKLEKPRGRAFPLLTCSMSQAREFDQRLAAAMISKSKSMPRANIIKGAQITEDCWQEVGYSCDATFYHTFNKLSPEDYYTNQTQRNFDIFLGTMQLFQDKNTLQEALAEGVISRASAVAFLTATLEYMDAMRKMGSED